MEVVIMNEKIFWGIFGIFLIVGIVGLSGCTSTAKKETVIFDQNVNGTGVVSEHFQYVNVPNGASVRVEISNVTMSNGGAIPSVNIWGLNVEGQQGQPLANYQQNILEVKQFREISNGYSGNVTLKSGIKSVGIWTSGIAKTHIKVVAIS